MRQVARRLKDGRIELVEVPEPVLGPGQVAVSVEASLISTGTERSTLEVAGKSLLGKARARPEQARQVLERARREGVRSTWELVRRRLEELGPLGYSAAGTVLEADPAASGIRPGSRVAIAGAGAANHAEIDVVPSLLCAPVPEGVSSEQAAFATLGAIALHGFRRAEVGVGETVAVVGLGLVGQLASRIALAAGCRVLATDLDPGRAALAAAAGAEAEAREALAEAAAWSGQADAVLVCAATASEDPARLAAKLARDGGVVVVVGDVGLKLPREPYYQKELELRLSRSYGPGRYEPGYEEHGLDYPLGQVRWTEQRNLAAFLELLAGGRLSVDDLITHRYTLAEAEAAFAELREGEPLAVLFDCTAPEPEAGARAAAPEPVAAPDGRRSRVGGAGGRRFGLIGAGNFATATVIPGLVGAGLTPAAVASRQGLAAESTRRAFEFERVAAGLDELLDLDLDLICICTRHDSHAELAARSLAAGVATYVEKPLALDAAGLTAVAAALESGGAPLVVGFNRRHSPAAAALRAPRGRRLMSYRVNAGPLPASHWGNDLARGGGRLAGEGCHFIDFLIDQAPADPVTVSAGGFGSDPALPRAAADNFSVEIAFADGSLGSVHYAADAPAQPFKERFETSFPGGWGMVEDFGSVELWRDGSRERITGTGKGHPEQFAHLAQVLAGEAEAASGSYLLSSLATLSAVRSLGSGRPEPVLEPAADREANGAALSRTEASAG